MTNYQRVVCRVLCANYTHSLKDTKDASNIKQLQPICRAESPLKSKALDKDTLYISMT